MTIWAVRVAEPWTVGSVVAGVALAVAFGALVWMAIRRSAGE